MNSASPRFRLAELSERFSLELRGDGMHEVTSVGTLASAGPEQISFLSNRSYRGQLLTTTAGAVILHAGHADECPVSSLISGNPHASFAVIARLFDTRPATDPGVHATAVVDPTASIGADVHIGANAVIGAACKIGRGSSVGAGCVIGPESSIGEACQLKANVTLSDRITIGNRVIIHSGAVIGSDGFGLAFAGSHWEKVPQTGSVVIGDDCEIGANTAIDRGAIEDTVLEEDVRIDNLVQIAHNVHIGAHTAIAACTGIAGSTRLGRNCLLGGGIGIEGHIEIADGVTIGAMSALKKSITEAGSTWGSAVPARPLRSWQRSLSHINKLDEMAKRLRALEQSAMKQEKNEQ